MYLAKKSGAPWGILTNGKNWLLLKRPVAFEKTTVEIDLEDHRRGRLRRGYAGGMDESCDLPKASGPGNERFDRLARGDVGDPAERVTAGARDLVDDRLRVGEIAQHDLRAFGRKAVCKNFPDTPSGAGDDDDAISESPAMRGRSGR